MGNLEAPINLRCMSLNGGRKPEYPEQIHTESHLCGICMDSNPGLSCCEASVLTHSQYISHCNTRTEHLNYHIVDVSAVALVWHKSVVMCTIVSWCVHRPDIPNRDKIESACANPGKKCDKSAAILVGWQTLMPGNRTLVYPATHGYMCSKIYNNRNKRLTCIMHFFCVLLIRAFH